MSIIPTGVKVAANLIKSNGLTNAARAATSGASAYQKFKDTTLDEVADAVDSALRIGQTVAQVKEAIFPKKKGNPPSAEQIVRIAEQMRDAALQGQANVIREAARLKSLEKQVDSISSASVAAVGADSARSLAIRPSARGPQFGGLPVAITSRSRNPGPTFRRSGAGNIRIKHRELLVAVTSVGPDFASTAPVRLNPGISAAFPWLSTIASSYQSYFARSVQLQFVPNVGTGLPGTIYMYHIVNAEDSVPSTEQEAADVRGCVTGSVWTPLTLSIGSRELMDTERRGSGNIKYVRVQDVASDLNLYDMGYVIFAQSGTSAEETVQGHLWIEYDIELKNPIIHPTASLSASTRAGSFIARTQTWTPSLSGYVNWNPMYDDLRITLDDDKFFRLPYGRFLVVLDMQFHVDGTSSSEKDTVVLPGTATATGVVSLIAGSGASFPDASGDPTQPTVAYLSEELGSYQFGTSVRGILHVQTQNSTNLSVIVANGSLNSIQVLGYQTSGSPYSTWTMLTFLVV